MLYKHFQAQAQVQKLSESYQNAFWEFQQNASEKVCFY